MIDIESRTQVVLRDAGFRTWPLGSAAVPTVCFENEVVLGFIFIFADASSLASGWEGVESSTLRRYRTEFRAAGTKAWNVYSIFLVEQDVAQDQLERIEENFALTRKIARGGVRTVGQIQSALLALLPLQSRPSIQDENFEARLASQLKDDLLIKALFSDATSSDLTNLLLGSP